MHAWYNHVPQFMVLFGNVNNFNQQGMEKYNDVASNDYFRSSNHKRGAFEQMLLKKCQMQHFEAIGCVRPVREYRCENCRGLQHSIKTCTKPCSTKPCSFPTCCAHLSKVNGQWVRRCTLVPSVAPHVWGINVVLFRFIYSFYKGLIFDKLKTIYSFK